MIIYATKKTIERCGIKVADELPHPHRDMAQILIEREQNDRLHEWGCKLFYFNKRKCLQLVNFASKLTVILVDVKVADMSKVCGWIVGSLFEIYAEDKEMLDAMNKLFSAHSLSCYSRLVDRSAISTLNRTQSDYLYDGYRLIKYIHDGVLDRIKLNKDINFDWLFTRKAEGKTLYYYSGELFREMVLNRVDM